jgi:hypothetical protein
VLDGCERIGQVEGVGAGNEYHVHVRTPAEFFGRCECVRYRIALRIFAALLGIAAGESYNLRVFGGGEAWHQPLNGVQSESGDSVANHGFHLNARRFAALARRDLCTLNIDSRA